MRSCTPAFVLLLVAACSSDSTPGGAQRDAATASLDALIAHPDAAAARPDAAAVQRDAAATIDDAGDIHDDASVAQPDAAPIHPDAAPMLADASQPVDSGLHGIDAGFQCGMLGQPCGPQNECGAGGLSCVDPPGLCMPTMPTCGGFAQMRCPGTAPVCLYYQGADYGPCLTVAERDCVCNNPQARVHFPDC